MAEEMQVLQAEGLLLTLQNDGKPDPQSGDERESLSAEQFLRLNIRLPQHAEEDYGTQDVIHIIAVVDQSGSMAGSAWKQVLGALQYVVDESWDNPSVHLTIITYSSEARKFEMSSTKEDTIKKIQHLSCGGVTDFVKAFKAITQHISDINVDKTVVMFMTDGFSTVDYPDSGGYMHLVEGLARQWQQTIHHPIVVHALGFSRDHNLDMLTKFCKFGTEPGMYRYCEPQDGVTALQEKFQELFDFIHSTPNSVDVDICIGGEDRLLGPESHVSKQTLKGEVIKGQLNLEDNADSEKTASEGGEDLSILVEAWIYLKDPTSMPVLDVAIDLDMKGKKVHMPVMTSIRRRLMTSAEDKVMWSLRILSRNTNFLTTEVGTAITDNADSSKCKRLCERLEKLQKRLRKSNIYGHGISKQFRADAFEFVKEVQQKTDTMQKMLAEVMRNESKSVGLLARANDLRYSAAFSKNRRQRLMDRRVVLNVQQAKKAQQELDALLVDLSELETLSQNALDFFSCILSMTNIKEMMMDESEKTNALGFGVAVKRSEHVLDEPTLLQFFVISGTLVSRTSIMDAFEHNISVEGHLRTHGGFCLESPIGVATVGTSREPINAWLPLYICKTHWNRVKTMLKPTLGYLATLDPLGYSFNQMDLMFMLLGSMIGQLDPVRTSEHHIKLMLAFHRTCYALCKDFNLTEQIGEVVQKFAESAEGRTKDVIANLYTLIGYMVCLPHDKAREALGIQDGADVERSMQQLWLAFLAENLRRGAGKLLKESSDKVVSGILDKLLHGCATDHVCTPSEAKAYLKANTKLMNEKTKKSDKETLSWSYDPAEGVTEPELKFKHMAKVDKAMEIWAQAKCGVIVNKNQNQKVKEATKVIEGWVADGQEEVKGQMSEAIKGVAEDKAEYSFDPNCVTKEMLDKLIQVLNDIAGYVYPQWHGVASCIAYVNMWMTESPDITQLDTHSGVAPEEMIVQVRKALSMVYSCMQEEQEEQRDEDLLVVDESMLASQSAIENSPQGGTTPVENSNKPAAEEGNDNWDDDADDDADDDDDDDDDDDYYSDDGDDDFPQYYRKPDEDMRSVRFLDCLCLLVSAESDVAMLCRGMACQVVSLHSNAKARAAAKDGQLKDMKLGVPSAVETLCDGSGQLLTRRSDLVIKLQQRALWIRANQAMYHATTTWAFTGYLMHTYQERGEGFQELVDLLTDPEQVKVIKPPCLLDKVKVMVFGKLEDYVVIANGNMWMPEKKMAAKFIAVIGEEAWDEIDLYMRSNIQIHVYRESDIPNRHGHCNSNPYIPNILRKKLGMALLPETMPRTKNRRIHSALTT